MRLDEPIEHPGFFWLPEQDQEKIPGTLKIEKSGNIKVDLFGALDVDSDDPLRKSLNPSSWSWLENSSSYERVHGLIQGRALTLDECFPIHSNHRVGGGVSQSTIHANRAYLGAWYRRDEVPTFSHTAFAVEGLHQWLRLSGFDREIEYDAATITKITHFFTPPSEITTKLPNGSELAFGLSWSESGLGADATEAKITQRASMVIRHHSPVPLDQHLSTSLIFQRLLSFAATRSVDVMALVGYSRDFTRDSHEVPVEIYFASSEAERATVDLRWFRMLFTYPDIESRFDDVITTWFDKYEIVGPAINLYDGLISGAYRYIEGQFLATAQAAEAFHRRALPQQPKMTDEEFQRIMESIPESIPSETRDRVHNLVGVAKQQPLRERLDDMVKPFQHLFGDEAENLAKDVTTTRNSLAHTAVARGDFVDDPISLFRLQQKLEALLQLHLLKLLGFSGEEIDKIAGKQEIKRKLS